MEEYTPVRDAQEALARFCKMPELIEFIDHVPGLIYKLYVYTTGGKCQSIYRSKLEHSASKSEVSKE